MMSFFNPYSQDGSYLKQADYFSMFFSRKLGINCNLSPVWSHFSRHPLHFVIQSDNGPLSTDNKMKILQWCIDNQPAWICRWWRDESFEKDRIILNKNGELCIECHSLLHMIIILDPFFQSFTDQIAKALYEKYKIELSVHFDSLYFFLSNKNMDNDSLFKLNKRIKKDIYQNTQHDIGIQVGRSSAVVPREVIRCQPNQLPDQNDSSTTIFERFNQTFLCRSTVIDNRGIMLTINRDLRPFLALLNIQCPGYFPLNESPNPTIIPNVEIHPALSSTKWKTIAVFFMAWFTQSNEDSSSEIQSLDSMLRTIFERNDPCAHNRLT